MISSARENIKGKFLPVERMDSDSQLVHGWFSIWDCSSHREKVWPLANLLRSLHFAHILTICLRKHHFWAADRIELSRTCMWGISLFFFYSIFQSTPQNASQHPLKASQHPTVPSQLPVLSSLWSPPRKLLLIPSKKYSIIVVIVSYNVTAR